MENQVEQETIVQKERSDVHMSYMKDQVETKKPQFRRKDLMYTCHIHEGPDRPRNYCSEGKI